MNTLASHQKQNLDLAINLFNQLENYGDEYTNDLKAILDGFIKEPSKDLKQMIVDIEADPNDAFYVMYDMNINILIAEILYPEYEEISN